MAEIDERKAPADTRGRDTYAVLKMGMPRGIAKVLDYFDERNRPSTGLAWFLASPDTPPYEADDLHVWLYASSREIRDGSVVARLTDAEAWPFPMTQEEAAEVLARLRSLDDDFRRKGY